MSEDSYLKFIKKLKNWVLPPVDSDLLPEIIKRRYTPEEAELLSKLPMRGQTAKQLSKISGIPVEDIEPKLDEMARKGLIYRYEEKKKVNYSIGTLMDSIYRMPWWLGQDEEWMVELSSLVNKYYIEGYGDLVMGYPTSPMRAIPINQTIIDDRKVMPYEDILKIVDDVEYFSVVHCSCRHRHNIDPNFEKSKYETWNCFHFNDLGRHVVRQGMGKEITKEETLKIFKESADAGLVHSIDNFSTQTTTDVTSICNCSKDYCLFFEKIKMHPGVLSPRGQHTSNYYRAWEDEKKCIKCGLCAKRCPIEAIKFIEEEKKITFDKERCIGCGVCVHKCPTEAISLKLRGEPLEPHVKHPLEFLKKILEERGQDAIKVLKENM